MAKVRKKQQLSVNENYIPVSKGKRLGVQVPGSMAFETQQALKELVRINGNIDEYVRRKLKYASKPALFAVLAAEQIDSVAMAINQIEEGNGLIIADQTGIGKGRQAAAIIRYAIMNGYVPVFISEKPSLFSDMYRDLDDIDAAEFRPLIYNLNKDGDVKDAQGKVVYKAFRDNAQLRDKIEEETDLPEGYDYVMTTYSQLNTDWIAIKNRKQQAKKNLKMRPQFKTAFLRAIAPKCIFILDEAHNAGGVDSIVGVYLREVLKKSKGAVYLSATFAKRPDNMPLYAVKTAMQEASLSDEGLINAIQGGGLPLQEIISSQLVSSGQMLRRQRSYDGIKVTYKTLKSQREKHVKIFDTVTAIIRQIIAFQEVYIKDGVIKNKEKELEEMGTTVEETKGTAKAGVDNMPYFSKIFNVIDQLLFSIKAEDVAKEAVRLLNEDKKVVIAFKSTMGSFLADYGLTDGEPIGYIDFSATLQKGLEGVMKYTVRDVMGGSSNHVIAVKDLPPSGQDAYHNIELAIQRASSGIGISPIDVIIDIIENSIRKKGFDSSGKYYKVAEVTGRKQRISNITSKNPVVRSFKSDANKAFREFNQGVIDVLLINQSGSTGLSAHSSDKFKDQRQRVMIIHQAEVNVNTEVQKRGRVNRTGQVNKPAYLYISSDIPAEQRLFMMLKSKLKSLDATTTASQETSKTQLESVDFLNKYGDVLLANLLAEDRELDKKLGYPLSSKEKVEKLDFSIDGLARKVTGRVAVLPVKEQEEFYENTTNSYLNMIRKLKEQGEYDLEADFLALDAEIKKSFVKIKGKGGYTPFGQDSVLEQVEVNVLRKPFKKTELLTAITNELNGLKNKAYETKLLEDLDRLYPDIIDEKTKASEEKIQELEDSVVKIKNSLGELEEKAKEKAERDIKKTEERVKKLKETVTNMTYDMHLKEGVIRDVFKTFYIGKVTRIHFSIGENWSWGVCIGIHVNHKMKNPYAPSNINVRFAVADSRRIVEEAVSSATLSQIRDNALRVSAVEEEKILSEWDAQYVDKNRQMRYIVSGNLLQAIGDQSLKGKLVKYTEKDKSISSGVFLHEEFGKGEAEIKTTKLIKEGVDEIFNLSIGQEFSSNDKTIRFKNKGSHFEVYVPSSVASGGKYFKDQELLQYLKRTQQDIEEDVSGKFIKAGGNEMQGLIFKDQIRAFCDVLSDKHSVMINAEIEKGNAGEKMKQKVRPRKEVKDTQVDVKRIIQALKIALQEKGKKAA
jgi:hypothetical protein